MIHQFMAVQTYKNRLMHSFFLLFAFLRKVVQDINHIKGFGINDQINSCPNCYKHF